MQEPVRPIQIAVI